MSVDTSDPFAPSQPVPFERLKELLGAEAILAAKGRTCPLKEKDWSHPSCSSCPERGSRGPLCGIGVAQEEQVGRMATA